MIIFGGLIIKHCLFFLLKFLISSELNLSQLTFINNINNSIMEHKLDELLKQLHRYLFADSEQVIVELRHYMLDRSLKEAELGK